jgi:adenine-specific DNA-methyltransferase
MYPRLKLARNLLTEDGVIFISIDDNEQSNLKRLCDEVFGEDNFIGNINWLKRNAQNDAINIQKNHEYILVYAKNIDNAHFSKLTMEDREVFSDDRGEFYYPGAGLTTGGAGGTLNARPNLGYTIYYNPSSKSFMGVDDYDHEKAKVSNNEDDVYQDRNDLLEGL